MDAEVVGSILITLVFFADNYYPFQRSVHSAAAAHRHAPSSSRRIITIVCDGAVLETLDHVVVFKL